jgi:hypothetical protein
MLKTSRDVKITAHQNITVTIENNTNVTAIEKDLITEQKKILELQKTAPPMCQLLPTD